MQPIPGSLVLCTIIFSVNLSFGADRAAAQRGNFRAHYAKTSEVMSKFRQLGIVSQEKLPEAR